MLTGVLKNAVRENWGGRKCKENKGEEMNEKEKKKGRGRNKAKKKKKSKKQKR